MSKSHGFDELLTYLIHENKYMITEIKSRPTSHPDPRALLRPTRCARENPRGLQTPLGTHPEQGGWLEGGGKACSRLATTPCTHTWRQDKVWG